MAFGLPWAEGGSDLETGLTFPTMAGPVASKLLQNLSFNVLYEYPNLRRLLERA